MCIRDRNKTGAGNDFLGWVELPENYDKEEVQLMKETDAKLREKVDVLLVLSLIHIYIKCFFRLIFFRKRDS